MSDCLRQNAVVSIRFESSAASSREISYEFQESYQSRHARVMIARLEGLLQIRQQRAVIPVGQVEICIQCSDRAAVRREWRLDFIHRGIDILCVDEIVSEEFGEIELPVVYIKPEVE